MAPEFLPRGNSSAGRYRRLSSAASSFPVPNNEADLIVELDHEDTPGCPLFTAADRLVAVTSATLPVMTHPRKEVGSRDGDPWQRLGSVGIQAIVDNVYGLGKHRVEDGDV